jgi:hypothetical protein
MDIENMAGLILKEKKSLHDETIFDAVLMVKAQLSKMTNLDARESRHSNGCVALGIIA